MIQYSKHANNSINYNYLIRNEILTYKTWEMYKSIV